MAFDYLVNPEVKETATCTWTINGFNNINTYVGFPAFCAPNSKDIFQLFFEQNSQLFGVNHVYICLGYSGNKHELPLEYHISILDENGYEQYTREYIWNYCKSGYIKIDYKFPLKNGFIQLWEYVLNCYEPDYIWSNYNMTNYIPADKCNELLVDGSLTIYCEVNILKNKPQPPTNLMLKETATFTWNIDGYSNVNEKTDSPKFSSPMGNDKFELTLIPNSTLFDLCHVFLRLHYIGNQTEMPLQYRLSILDLNDNKKYTKEYAWNYSKVDYVNNEYDAINYIAQNTCKQLAVDDSLKIYCEVDFWKITDSESHSEMNETDKTPDIMNYHQAFLKNCELVESRVHKAILASRSKTFQDSITPLPPTSLAYKPISHQYFYFESILSQFENKIKQKLRRNKLSKIILDKLTNTPKAENNNYIYNFGNAKLHNVIVNANSNETKFGDVNFINQIYGNDSLNNLKNFHYTVGLMLMLILSFVTVKRFVQK